MATCYVSEYATVGQPGPGNPTHQAPQEPASVEQNIPITGSSSQSATFSPFTKLVRVHVDSIASILFGQSPTAVTTAKRLAANQTEYFSVIPGQKVAVIQNV